MKKFIYYILFVILIASISPVVFYFRAELKGFIIDDNFDGFATIFSAFVVIFVYFWDQRRKKIDAARLIIKEIDAALPVARGIADGKYDQKVVCIETDSWQSSVHFFVNDLSQEEISQINKIYSRGKYINGCIEEVDKIKKNKWEEIHWEAFKSVEEATEGKLTLIANSVEVKNKIVQANSMGGVMINFAKEAAKDISDSDGWTGYYKLRQIAKLPRKRA